MFTNKRILVVGGAGFVGANLVRHVLALNAERVLVVDNLLSSELENLPIDKRLNVIVGSITDQSILNLIEDSYDYIFHLATYHGNQSSIFDPLADHENNTLTTLKLFNHIRSYKRLVRCVYSSAGCAAAEKTFGDAHATSEDAPLSLAQDSPYSISKVIGEYYSVYFHKQFGLPVVRARFQNVYGPGEVLGAGRWRGTSATVWRNVTPTFIYKAITGSALPLENAGESSRDFIYVDDICRGLIACATKGISGDVYNLATGQEQTIKDLAELINQHTGNNAGVTLLPRRSWDTSGKRFGCTQKSNAILNFTTQVDFKSGIARTVEWSRRNFALIQKCMTRHEEYMTKITVDSGTK